MIWLTFFYLLFHSFLNTMGEILGKVFLIVEVFLTNGLYSFCPFLGFADRNYYNDWWNSSDVMEFWKSWNLPVHRWCVRHMYKPLLSRGSTTRQASFLVFLFSAFFHEYAVSVPLRMWKYYAFLGMLLQVIYWKRI